MSNSKRAMVQRERVTLAVKCIAGTAPVMPLVEQMGGLKLRTCGFSWSLSYHITFVSMNSSIKHQ